MPDFYEDLERIRGVAALLQSLPACDRPIDRIATETAVRQCAEQLALCLMRVAPQVEVWAGDRNDRMRKGRPAAAEWDWLLAPFRAAWNALLSE